MSRHIIRKLAEKVVLETENGSIEGYRFFDRSIEWEKDPIDNNYMYKRHVFNDSAFVYVRNSTLLNRQEFELRYHVQKILIDELKSRNTKPSFEYVYIYTDISQNSNDINYRKFDFIIFVVYKVDKEILNNVIHGTKNNDSEEFLQMLGYSKTKRPNFKLALAKEETDLLINKYYKITGFYETKEDKRAVSYIDKKINRILSGKDIKELYEGLFGKKSEQKNYKYRIAFINGQHQNNICCTLWYSDGISYEKDSLTYFDMCVFDAVCTIWNNDRKQFYLNTIWELLSGNENIRFSRTLLKDRIRDSVEKLQRLRIVITSAENPPGVLSDDIGELFINVRKVLDTSGREIYEIKSCPPLWRYAVELQKGQIVQVPSYKLDGRRYFKWDEFGCSEVSEMYSFLEDSHRREKIIAKMKKSSILDPDYKCSVWKAVLHFYLAHRSIR